MLGVGRAIPMLTVTSLIGLGASGVVGGGILIVRSPKLGSLPALGIALSVIALLSPVLYPWHLLWGCSRWFLAGPNRRRIHIDSDRLLRSTWWDRPRLAAADIGWPWILGVGLVIVAMGCRCCAHRRGARP